MYWKRVNQSSGQGNKPINEPNELGISHVLCLPVLQYLTTNSYFAQNNSPGRSGKKTSLSLKRFHSTMFNNDVINRRLSTANSTKLPTLPLRSLMKRLNVQLDVVHFIVQQFIFPSGFHRKF